MVLTGAVGIFLIGLCLLAVSADWLIQGCVKLSSLLKVTPFFIGLIIVAFGTSIPEAGVGVTVALRKQSHLALATVIGSNIANIGLILGVCALVRPITIVNKNLFKREMPVLMLAVGMLYVVSLDLTISRREGLAFIMLFVLFCFIAYRGSRALLESQEVRDFAFNKVLQKLTAPFGIFVIVILALGGIGLGAKLMVDGGVNAARLLGINPWVIGIVFFAAGTSLPELAASLSASAKKASSISIGTIVGSNIFNILFALGIVAVIQPIAVPASILRFELPLLLLFSIMLFTVMKTEYTVTRAEGLCMFVAYLVFIALLFLK
jgi:cation:H+ antiporter